MLSGNSLCFTPLAYDALVAQQELTEKHPKTEIVYYHHEYGHTEHQPVHLVFMRGIRKGEQKPYYSLSRIGDRWNSAVKRAGIRRRNPYHTRHTFACRF